MFEKVTRRLKKLPIIVKKLLAYCEEVTSAERKVTNHRIKEWAHFANIAIVIYYGFEHLGIMHLKSSKTKKLGCYQVFEKSYQQIEKVTSKLWRSYKHIVKNLLT